MRSAREVRAFLENLKTEQPVRPPPLYRCQKSNFGSYLIAANLLRYHGAELAPNGRDVDFLFYDPPEVLTCCAGLMLGPQNLLMRGFCMKYAGYLLSEVKRVQAEAGNAGH